VRNINVSCKLVLTPGSVINGSVSDTPSELTNEEFHQLIGFTRQLFVSTTLKQGMDAKQKANKVNPSLMTLGGKIMSEHELKYALEDEDGDTLVVLKRINSLRILRNDMSPQVFAQDVLGGYVAIVERGKMGLARV
jgi:hypothetical protein